MLTTPSGDSQPIDNQACIRGVLAVIRDTAGIDYLKVEADRSDLVDAIEMLGDAVMTHQPDERLEPLIAAVLTAANGYFQAPVGISLRRCEQTGLLMLLLYPAGTALHRPQGASLH